MHHAVRWHDADGGLTSITGPKTCTTVNGVSGVWQAPSYPYGTIGDRKTEWTNRTYHGCYLLAITIEYGYQPWTPLVAPIVGTITLSTTTATVAEF